jgi:hypothetical protein
MGERRGTATVCRFGHEKTGVRMQAGREVLYCTTCAKTHQERHFQKNGRRVKKACRYGHPLPPTTDATQRRSCPTCQRLAREAKERGHAA